MMRHRILTAAVVIIGLAASVQGANERVDAHHGGWVATYRRSGIARAAGHQHRRHVFLPERGTGEPLSGRAGRDRRLLGRATDGPRSSSSFVTSAERAMVMRGGWSRPRPARESGQRRHHQVGERGRPAPAVRDSRRGSDLPESAGCPAPVSATRRIGIRCARPISAAGRAGDQRVLRPVETRFCSRERERAVGVDRSLVDDRVSSWRSRRRVRCTSARPRNT